MGIICTVDENEVDPREVLSDGDVVTEVKAGAGREEEEVVNAGNEAVLPENVENVQEELVDVEEPVTVPVVHLNTTPLAYTPYVPKYTPYVP